MTQSVKGKMAAAIGLALWAWIAWALLSGVVRWAVGLVTEDTNDKALEVCQMVAEGRETAETLSLAREVEEDWPSWSIITQGLEMQSTTPPGGWNDEKRAIVQDARRGLVEACPGGDSLLAGEAAADATLDFYQREYAPEP